ncbi:hypothetical protein DMH01_36550 [Amycolatopsis sp. WAC 04182]|uniref:hypothetical protein n=1 Tax=Amycolatopsis sp. WAC 04182 TaxID=2203198 RepID=UPI000F766338|nr:hypothetical protein [Amycolatopsis sp. WAC 04182]RSN54451.1 hypothetical protein DMH01_36550 [Amycolatopsis sp. WAC 04182]
MGIAPRVAEAPSTKVSALDLIDGGVRRLDFANQADILPTAQHVFAVMETVGELLAEADPGSAALARAARRVHKTIVRRLGRAEAVTGEITMLAPEAFRFDGRHHRDDDSSRTTPDLTTAGAVRRRLLALAIELESALSLAAENSRYPAYADAVREAASLAHELALCWDGSHLA